MIGPKDLAHEVPDILLDLTVEEILQDSEVDFFFPYLWQYYDAGDGLGGSKVKDPLTIYTSIDVCGTDERITFRTTIKELLEDVYEGFATWNSKDNKTGEMSEYGVQTFKDIKNALLSEVKRIDDWIAISEKVKRNDIR